jgi:hypothetical protein
MSAGSLQSYVNYSCEGNKICFSHAGQCLSWLGNWQVIENYQNFFFGVAHEYAVLRSAKASRV